MQVLFILSIVKKKIEFRSQCPISTALDIFGDKWTLLVIRDLLFNEKKTYGEFLNSEEKIATCNEYSVRSPFITGNSRNCFKTKTSRAWIENYLLAHAEGGGPYSGVS